MSWVPRCKNNRGHPGNYLPVRAIASRMSRIIHHKLGNTDKILNDFFSASSVVSSHGPSAAAKEHEKRILESILPPDLRCKPFLHVIHDHRGRKPRHRPGKLWLWRWMLIRTIFRHLIRGGPNASTFQSIQVSFDNIFDFLERYKVYLCIYLVSTSPMAFKTKSTKMF